MRHLTAADLDILASPHYAVYQRVLVTDTDGVERDLSDLEGLDWCVSVEWGEDVDQPIVQPRIQIRRQDTGTGLSLSPFDESSPLNRRLDGSYAPLIDAGRRIRILTATVPPGSVPAPGDWREVFDGEIDEVEWQTDPMLVVCRDPGGELQDTIIEDPQEYGSESGVPLHVVMQELLDDVLGAGVVTLHVPEAPGFMVTRYKPDEGPLMDALRACAGSIGWDVRYRWDEASQGFRLTLIKPDREKSVPDHEFGPDDYIDVNRLAVSRADVRNVVQVAYPDSTTHQVERVTVQDEASIARYGRRFMRIAEGEGSPIDTGAEADTLARAALADLAEPKAEQEIELRYFWPAQLGDLYLFRANGVHYTTDQVLAVVGIRHRLTENQQRTVLVCRGKPSGGYLTWLKRAAQAPETTVELYAQCRVALVETYPDRVVYEVTAVPGYGTVCLYELNGATLAPGSPGLGVPAPSGTRWTILRPVPESAQGQATWRAEAPGYVPDDQSATIAQQGRDTVSLAIRATVVGRTATTITVRTAVADPLKGEGLPSYGVTIVAVGENVQSVQAVGFPSPGTASIPADQLTDDLDTTGYVDWVITRRPPGSGEGSVTWTATATRYDPGPILVQLRVQASDTQVIPDPGDGEATILPPLAELEVLGLGSHATLEVVGKARGGPTPTQYRRREYQLGSAPPAWGGWQALSAGIAVYTIARPTGGLIVAEAQVRDADGRESAVVRIEIEPAGMARHGEDISLFSGRHGANISRSPVDSTPLLDVVRYLDNDGNANKDFRANDGAGAAKILPKGMTSGWVVNGQTIVFGTTYNNLPEVIYIGGATDEGRNKWGTLAEADTAVSGGNPENGTGTGSDPRPTGALISQAFGADVTPNSFTARLRLKATTAPTPTTKSFGAPTLLSEGGTSGACTPSILELPAVADQFIINLICRMNNSGGSGISSFLVTVEVSKNFGVYEPVGSKWIDLPYQSNQAIIQASDSIPLTVSQIKDGNDSFRVVFSRVIAGPGTSNHQVSVGDLRWYRDSGAKYASATPNGNADAVRFVILSQG